MRALLPEPVEPVDIHECYARDWLDRGGVRVNMISSVDGAAAADGLSAGLQTPADNRVFAVLRDLADVILVGSGTVRAEGYRPIKLGARRLQLRTRFGLAATVPIAVWTPSLNLDPSSRLFAEASPEARPIVLTCAVADSGRRASLAKVADVVTVGEQEPEPGRIRSALAERGLTRVLCEGGPTLFGLLAAAGEADELCLSLSPILAGPGAPRIVGGRVWDGGPRRYALRALLEEDGALFLRLTAR